MEVRQVFLFHKYLINQSCEEKKCSLHNTHGNEYVLAVSIFSPQNLISYFICKREQIYCISNRETRAWLFWGRSLYQIRHRKNCLVNTKAGLLAERGCHRPVDVKTSMILELIMKKSHFERLHCLGVRSHH